jgi:hypothetical protein
MSGGVKKDLPKKTVAVIDEPAIDDSKNAELRKKYLETKDKVIPEKTME